jgi:tRNA (cytidine/uridine-2'-O-)-methyltransferase
MPRVVLWQPQIPPNTGNVARTCAATGSELHLIEPLGFQIDDRQLRRAGLETTFLANCRRQGGRLVALSSHAAMAYTDFAFCANDWLLFGQETDGLPARLLAQADGALTIPMAQKAQPGQGGVRSLNLSVAVAVVLFESLRQIQIQQGK